MSILNRSNSLMTNAPMNARFAPGRALYRARFNSGDTPSVAGTVTAPDPGVRQGIWEGGLNEFAVKDSAVVRGTVAGSITLGLPIFGTGAMMSWEIIEMPVGSSLYIDLFSSTIGGNNDCYRLSVNTASAFLQKRIAGVSTNLSASFPVTKGQRVGVRWVGGLLTAFVNGVTMAEAINSEVNPNGYARLACGGSTTGFAADTVEVDVYA